MLFYDKFPPDNFSLTSTLYGIEIKSALHSVPVEGNFLISSLQLVDLLAGDVINSDRNLSGILRQVYKSLPA